jgi:hypothetical protein
MTDLLPGIRSYTGILLNHLEMLYQPGERELAVQFCEALGWQVIDTPQKTEMGSTYMIVRFEPAESEYQDNVMYLSEMRPEHVHLENTLSAVRADRADLQAAVDRYIAKAKTRPHGIPHFGVRYLSFDGVQATVDRLQASLPTELSSRVAVQVVRPGDPGALTNDLIQAFVYTDLICTGLFTLGQLIELQGQRRIESE